jgi:hypothetical protein
VHVAFDIPDAVGQSALPSASDLLLLESPVWKFDLVGEQRTASHDMDKSELGLDSSETLLCLSAVRLALDDLNTEQVICIAFEAFISICGYLVLPVSLGDGCADIVGVETTVSGDVVESDNTAILNVIRAYFVPGFRARDVWPSVVRWHDR